MTVSSITPVNNYAGNGTNKIFDFDFPIEDKSELVVTHISNDGTRTTLTCDLDYEIEVVTDNEDNFVSYGTSITFPISSSSYSILDEDEKISLALSLPIEQQKEMKNSNKLNLSTLEWCLDYLTRLIQILNRKTERAIKVQEGSGITTDVLATNLNKVADNSSIISSVADNLTTITSVDNNSQNINLVAGDLTNINAIAGDLTNIDNASSYASLAQDWANKTDGKVDGVEYSAKYYAEQASQGQVQSDWNQSDSTKKDYIKNKPTKLSDFTDDLGASPTHTHSQYLTSHQNINGKADVDLSNTNNTAKILMSGMGMPSSTYDELTLGASGSTYTAPANGYVYITMTGKGSGIPVIWMVEKDSNDNSTLAQKVFLPNNSSDPIDVWIPVSKNQSYTIGWLNMKTFGTGASDRFGFIYCVGSESEAS